MPQIFNVVRCFGCSTFQVHQVKKAKKWSCKVCGEKQSLIKVYGQGTGAECRQHVQKLNLLRQDEDEKEYEAAIDQECLDDFEEMDDYSSTNNLNGFLKLPQTSQNSSSSRWSKFLPHEDDSKTSQSQMEETDYMEEYNDQEEKRENAEKSNEFPYQEKRKNPFSEAYYEDPLPNSSDLMKKPRIFTKNNFQLSSVNQIKSHDWSHSVSVGSRNPSTNLTPSHNPIHFEQFTSNIDPITLENSHKISSMDQDFLKNKRGVPNSSTFTPFYANPPRFTEHKETNAKIFNDTERRETDLLWTGKSQNCLSGAFNEGIGFPAKELVVNTQNVGNRHSRIFTSVNGLKSSDGSPHTKKTLSTEDSYPRNINDNISLSSGVNKPKTVDGQMLPLFKLSDDIHNVSKRNLSFLNNLDKEKLRVNSSPSNSVKNIFQIDESEIDLDF